MSERLASVVRRGSSGLLAFLLLFGVAAAVGATGPTGTPTPTKTRTPTKTLTNSKTPPPTKTPPPSKTPTITGTRTSTPMPTPTPTPVANLVLSSQCSDDPAVSRVWKVHNTNSFAVPFTWKVYGIPVSGTDPISWNSFVLQQGTGTAAAGADTTFASPTVKGLNPAAIFWQNKRLPLGFGFWLSLSTTAACATPVRINPQPGQSVNMVSGTEWPGGDPFLQRQNETSAAFGTRTAQHILAGANDYRSVDLPFPDVNENDEEYAGDAWVGVFKSLDGGQTWRSTLHVGYPQDTSPEGQTFKTTVGEFGAAADPVVRAGTNGLFYYAAITLNRAVTGNPTEGALFVSRFMDLNNKENGDASQSKDPIRYVDSRLVVSTTATEFVDKPAMVVDIPRAGAGTCNLTVPQDAGSPSVSQTIPAGNVYLAYAAISPDSTHATLKFTKSTDCGASWSPPVALSTPAQQVSQGAAMAVDPTSGAVYVAWRQFAVGLMGEMGYQPNAINVVKITGGGTTVGPVVTVQSLNPYTSPMLDSFFEQGTSPGTFRTNAYSSIAIDGSGRVYLVWAQRISPLGDARIMLSTLEGSVPGAVWSTPSFVDNAAVVDDTGHSFSRGHQFMPQATFNGGRLTIIYYDLRLDHTLGLFDPVKVPGFPKPDARGRFELETRSPCIVAPTPNQPCAGEAKLADPDGAPVFTPFISDMAFTAGGVAYPLLTLRRHTLDVRLAQAGPGASPVFTTKRLSNYKFGTRGDETGPIVHLQQLQVNPGGFQMFSLGEVPYIGDYVHVGGLDMVKSSPGGSWVLNTAPSKAGTQFASWTSNQDVVPPYNPATGMVDWHLYTPPNSAAKTVQSKFDPGQTVPVCQPLFTGSRNQNIYGALITQDFLFSALQSAKPLSTTLQRSFVVVAQNLSNFDKSFRLVIENQPPGGWASFTAGTNSPLLPPSPIVTTLDLAVAAHSSASRSIFATSSSATADITVNIAETSAVNGPLVVNGLTGFVTLNGDGTNPALVQPDGGDAATINTVEVYTPNVTNPNVTNANPNVTNSGVTSPNVTNTSAPNVTNPNVTNPNVTNTDIASLTVADPNVTNPNVTNDSVTNPNVTNVDPSNPNVTNGSISDASYTVTNTGNTSASFRVSLVGTAPAPDVHLQLIITKTYKTLASQNCELFEQSHELLLSNIVNPVFTAPNANLNDPNILDPRIGNPAIPLKPNESFTVTVRAFTDPATLAAIVSQVAPVVVSQAATTTTNTPTAAAPGGVVIAPGSAQFLTSALPDGVVGVTYAASPVVSGISGEAAWSVSAGSLPTGLTLNPVNGRITGTPTAAGDVPFTLRASAGDLTASRDFTIRVAVHMVIEAGSLPIGRVGEAYTAGLSPTGGRAPFVWSIASGALPVGLSLSTGGAITGVPQVAGTSNFVAQAADSLNPAQIATRDFSITVNGAASVISTSSPGTVVAGQPFTLKFHVQDATGASIPGANVVLSLGSSPCSAATLTPSELEASTNAAGDVTFTNLRIDRGGIGYAVQAGVTVLGFGNFAGSAILNVEGYCDTGTMDTTLYEHVAVRLNDGRVLLAGGGTSPGSGASNRGQIYDPTTGAFSLISQEMIDLRRHPAATLLPNGKVLIAGGAKSLGGSDTTSLFDPASGFSDGPVMAVARLAPTTTLLADGHVLVAGGLDNDAVAQTNAQIYDPGTNAFVGPATMNVGRSYHTATLLNNGLVLIAGGFSSAPSQVPIGSAELYDPVHNTFTLIPGGMNAARGDHTATLLADGKVLLAGGRRLSSDISLNSAEVYDPVANSFTPTGSMLHNRGVHAAALLPNGKVLVSGGFCCGDATGQSPLASSEVFDPVIETFSATGDQSSGTAAQTATLLLDGRVLLAGGTYAGSTPTAAPAELFFTPPGPPLVVTTVALPDGALGNFYSVALQAANGIGPRTWTLTSGAPPAGLTLSSSGIISGTAGTVGHFSFTVRVSTDGPPAETATRALTITLQRTSVVVSFTHFDGQTPDVGNPQQPSNTVAGGIMAPVKVLVDDTNSGILFGQPVTLSLGTNPSGAVLSGTLTVLTGAGGIATFSNLSIDQPGAGYSLIASSPAVPGAASTLFNVLSPDLLFQTPPTDSVGGQTMSTVRVRVQDDTASPLQDVSVTMTIGSSPCAGATLSGSITAVTDEGGVANFGALAIDRGGLGYTLQASVTGVPSASAISTPFHLEGFCATGSTFVGRYLPAVVKLADGRVLVAGGRNGSVALNTAEIYNPTTGAFLATPGTLGIGRFDTQAVLLGDGRVLIAGGVTGSGDTATAEIFDPSGGGFFTSTANNMSLARRSFQATRLADGRVLVTGGANASFPAIGSAELFDPSSGLFSDVPSSMLVPRAYHTATLLPNGQVLLAGGADPGGVNTGFLEVFNPIGGSFALVGSLVVPRNSQATSLLPSGNLLVAGGMDPAGTTSAITSAEVFMPFSGSIPTGSLNAARLSPLWARLPEGRVLVAGGFSAGAALSSAEVYTASSPVAGTFGFTGGLIGPRGAGTAVALNDGRVLIVGSDTFSTTAELFYPRRPSLPVSPVFSEYSVPSAAADPQYIAAGPDGNLWFTEFTANVIGRITPVSGAFAEFAVPTPSAGPSGIVAGPDGNLWFAEATANQIGRITLGGSFTEFPIPTAASNPAMIALGPDGNLWFVENSGNKIGRITTTGTITITEFPIPTAASNAIGIAAGPDGNLWFTENDGNKIGRITTTGTFTEFPIPTAAADSAYIAAGPDGNLWFTEFTANQIGRITPSGTITEFPIPGAAPAGITSGPDGNLWFTEYFTAQIGVMTPTGAVVDFLTPTAASFPSAIVTGSDGGLWFCESAPAANKIGRVR